MRRALATHEETNQVRIHMQDALASLLEEGKGHLATAANAATHPSPPFPPDSWSAAPEPPQEPRSECESVLWLRSTIEGDKAAAKRTHTYVNPLGSWTFDNMQVRNAEGTLVVTHTWPDEGEHIARHDPQDTIARCEAELNLLDMHGPNRYGNCRACDPDSCGCTGSEDYPCATVCTILSGYRHREGFKPEWVSA